MNGYMSKKYALALEKEVIYLPACNVYLMKKDLPGGFYELENLTPNFFPGCFNSAAFNMDREEVLDNKCKQITLITNPLQNLGQIHNVGFKKEEYKSHYVVDLTKELQLAHGHWDEVRSFAKKSYEVSPRILNPTVNLVDYGRHLYSLMNPPVDSQESIINQLRVPGIVIFEAKIDNNLPEGIRTFYIQDKIAYFHLEAGNIKTQYAIMYQAILFFKQLGLTYLVLGPGGSFEKGFSNMELPTFKLTKVLINEKVATI